MSLFLYIKSLKAHVKHFNILKDIIFKNVFFFIFNNLYPLSLLGTNKSGLLSVFLLYHSDIHNGTNYYPW